MRHQQQQCGHFCRWAAVTKGCSLAPLHVLEWIEDARSSSLMMCGGEAVAVLATAWEVEVGQRADIFILCFLKIGCDTRLMVFEASISGDIMILSTEN